MTKSIITPHLQELLTNIAETNVTPERFGAVALDDTVEFQLPELTLFDDLDTIRE